MCTQDQNQKEVAQKKLLVAARVAWAALDEAAVFLSDGSSDHYVEELRALGEAIVEVGGEPPMTKADLRERAWASG